MTEEIIIDGVNVAGCEHYTTMEDCDGIHDLCEQLDDYCSIKKNCYYKQLKRLEQENKALKDNNNHLQVIIDDGRAENKRFREENKELKKDVQLFKCLDTFGESECHCACRCLGNEFCEDADKKINNYRYALEEIKEVASFHTTGADNEDVQNDMQVIIDKINEVLK